MALLIAILSFLTLLSCNPEEIPPQENRPVLPAPERPDDSNQPTTNRMKITIGNNSFTATLSTNATATAFKEMLPLTLTMNDFNNNEKVCSLPKELPTAPMNPGTIRNGDIMIYGSNSIVLFYKTFSTTYRYTRIGVVNDSAGLQIALGSGDVTVKFDLQ